MHERRDARDRLEERLLDRTLRALPLRDAPPTLESRVRNALARRAALPWWRRRIALWPAPAQVIFFLACGAAMRLAFLAGHWAATALAALSGAGAPLIARVLGVAASVRAFGELAASIAHSVPPSWLSAALASIAVLYFLIFGLTAVVYRTLYLGSPNQH